MRSIRIPRSSPPLDPGARRGGIERRIVATHVVILAVAAGLSLLVLWQGRMVTGQTGRLVGADMPAIALLSAFNADVQELEPILYEYYLTTDRARFLRRYSSRSRRIAGSLRRITAAFPKRHEISEIAALHQALSARAHDLDETLGAARIDWDRARAVLADVPAMAEVIERRVEGLVTEVQSRAIDRGAAIRSQVNGITALVIAFSTALVLVALVIGYYVNAYLAELAERKRLSMFPERAPNPVLSLTLDGELQYANPGARRLAARLAGERADPRVLLPPDLRQRLAPLQASGDTQACWTYERGNRALEGHVHGLRDFGVLHVYLFDVTDRRDAVALLEHRACHHSLTELPNRRAFLEQAGKHLTPRRRAAVVQLAVDRFGAITGQLGHPTGDRLLVAVAARLDAAVRGAGEICPDARLYHFDGERFAVLIPNLADDLVLEAFMRRLTRAVESPLSVEGVEIAASISAGAAIYPKHGADAVTLLKHADSAMQAAQAGAPGGMRCYDEALDLANRDRLELEHGLRLALEHEELSLVYQPQVEIDSGRIVAVEVLLRWHHAVLGAVSPVRFIPLAEETGLIHRIGEWVLRRACAQLAAWDAQGLPPLRLAVNVSARQFQHPGFPGLVAAALRDAGLPAERLDLEVTEGVVMHGAERTIRTLQGLRELGLMLSIDDFGTGYSSLAYLQRFPIDQLKVDQSFVRRMDRDHGSAAIARAVVALARSLDLGVVGEGVENAEQLTMLRRFGCHLAQGYWFSPPLDALSLAAVLERSARTALPAHAPITALRPAGG